MSARLNYYARCKETAAFQIQKLQKTLDRCVPEDELNNLRNEYETLAIKYKELLENGSNSVNYQLALKSTQANLDTLKKQHDELKEQLTIEKERRYLLENSINQLQSNVVGYVLRWYRFLKADKLTVLMASVKLVNSSVVAQIQKHIQLSVLRSLLLICYRKSTIFGLNVQLLVHI